MDPRKVIVAMSGGVDSSVAAWLLKEQGFDVAGVTMNLFSLPPEECTREDLRSCCGRRAVEDAHRTAVALGIPHYVADLRKEFVDLVVEDFGREYGRGRTPNPCVRCNEHIKFRALAERASRLGAEFVATGHHARVELDGDTGRYLLKKGRDREKDQSYFLHSMTQEQLGRTLFPVGGLTKAEVRSAAARAGLPAAQKKESQEICFVPDDDYVRFLRGRIPEAFRPGPILDKKGRRLGEHKGIAHYTVGQRRGLGVAAPRPLYVLTVVPEENAVIVGPDEDLYVRDIIAERVHFVSGETLSAPFRVRAKIRYRSAESPAVVTPAGKDTVRVCFERPQRAAAPGQSVVFYEGEVCLGGGLIDRMPSTSS